MHIRLLLLSVALFATTLLVAVGTAVIVDVYVLDHWDDKWGGRWGSVQIGFYFYGWFVAIVSTPAFALALLGFSRWLRHASARGAAVLGASAGLVAGVVSLSGLLKWLSELDDPYALFAVPGLAGAGVVALYLIANRERRVG